MRGLLWVEASSFNASNLVMEKHRFQDAPAETKLHDTIKIGINSRLY